MLHQFRAGGSKRDVWRWILKLPTIDFDLIWLPDYPETVVLTPLLISA